MYSDADYFCSLSLRKDPKQYKALQIKKFLSLFASPSRCEIAAVKELDVFAELTPNLYLSSSLMVTCLCVAVSHKLSSTNIECLVRFVILLACFSVRLILIYNTAFSFSFYNLEP